MGDIPTMRIVALGKTGSGKSSLYNTWFGEKMFTVNPSANSETKICESKTRTIDGTIMQLVDTPGFFDTDQNGTELSDELLKCIIKCAPGPHAFLLVLKVEKFTSQEQAVVDVMTKYFSEEALKFTTLVFTHGDQLPEGMKIEDWVKENKALNNLVEKCDGRCHVIDNKYWNNSADEYRNNQYQIKQLLETINKTMKENEGRCYSSDFLQTVQMIKEMEKDFIKQSSPDISEERLNKETNERVFTKLKKNWIGVTVGTLLGAFLGGLALGFLAPALGAPLALTCAAVGLGKTAGALLGGLAGGVVSEYSERVIKGMKDAAQKLHDNVLNPSKSNTESEKLLKSD